VRAITGSRIERRDKLYAFMGWENGVPVLS